MKSFFRKCLKFLNGMKSFFRKYLEFLKWGCAIILGGFYIWAINILLNNDNWVGVSALTTMLLAIVASWSITENRRIRTEDKELNSKKRRLEEVQQWINEVVIIKSECARPTGSPEEWRQRETKARIIVTNKKYIKTEAERLDSEFVTEIKLVNKIDRLSFMLEHYKGETLSAPEHQREIEDLCTESLIKISSIKAGLKI